MTLQTGRKITAFTLMEMLVVMAVIALLLGVSIPFFSSFSKGVKLKTAANDVVAVLNTARSYAITNRQKCSVVFDFSGSSHSYYISGEDGQIYGKTYNLPSSIRFYRPSAPDSPTTFSSHKAVFSSTGSLSGASGSVWLSDNKENIRRINVSHATGRVKVDREP